MDSAQPSRHSCHAGTTTKDNQRLPSDQNARFSASARSVLSQVKKSPLAFRPKRSEEHTSELQSLMRISYAVFCLKKKKNKNNIIQSTYLINLTHQKTTIPHNSTTTL